VRLPAAKHEVTWFLAGGWFAFQCSCGHSAEADRRENAEALRREHLDGVAWIANWGRLRGNRAPVRSLPNITA